MLYLCVKEKKRSLAEMLNSKEQFLDGLPAQLRHIEEASGPLQKYVKLNSSGRRELQATIQAFFKEWLMTSGSMRQVYDLARIERGEEC